MTDFIMQSWSQRMGVEAKLAMAIADLCRTLQGLTERSDGWVVFDTAFGSSYDRQQAEQFWAQWRVGAVLPEIEVMSQATLGQAHAAYGAITGKIYLSEQFLAQASPGDLGQVLMEEYGHYVDARINATDSPGDEGAIFAALVQGLPLTPGVLLELRAEDDTAWIEIEGQGMWVEQSSPVVSLALTTATVTEDGPQSLFYVFSRTGDPTAPLRVNFNVGGRATFESDYGQRGASSFGATSGTITFAAGASVAILSLDPSSDAVRDGNETVALTLAAGTGYSVGTPTAVTGTILDNDMAPGTVVRGAIASSYPGTTRHELRNSSAFAALKSDGSVVTWGHSSYGGDSSTVASHLSGGVTQILSTERAFAALKTDGSVITWGNLGGGGDSSAVASQLSSGVTQVFSALYAFAALKNDGSVVTWGALPVGGNSSGVASQLSSGVTQIFSTHSSFAALKIDGSVVTWGDYAGGGDSSGVVSQLSSGVTQIFSTRSSFAALKGDGSVVTWGSVNSGGNSSIATFSGSRYNYVSVASQLASGVTQIFSTNSAFAALKNDGSVVTWGASPVGGNSSIVTVNPVTLNYDFVSVADQLTSSVTQIFATDNAFAALKSDGSVVTWGDSAYGGNSTAVASQLSSGVIQVFSTGSAFAALKNDGSVVTWGDSAYGGNSTAVASQLSSGVVSFADPFNDDRLVPPPLPVITLAVSPASVTEDGTTNLVYTFTRSGSTASELIVNYTVGGTATLGTDYTGIADSPATKTVTFLANEATATVIVDPTRDTAVETNETVTLTLVSDSTYTIGTPEGVTGTILNDDVTLPVITLAVSPAAVTENGTANLVYTFTRTGDSSNALTVTCSVGGTADVRDYRQNQTANSYIRFTTLPIVIGQNHVFPTARISQKLNGPGELFTNPSNSGGRFATAKLDEFGNLYVKGDASYGGNGSSNYGLVLQDVVEVHAVSEGTFVALTAQRQLKSFGNWSGGGKTLDNIVKIATSASGFVALDSEGKVYSYGAYTSGGGGLVGSPPSSSVKIESIYAGGYGGYGAIDFEGNFWIWGYGSHGLTDTKAEKAIGIGFEYGKISILFEDGSIKTPSYGFEDYILTPFFQDGGSLSGFTVATATITFAAGSSTATLVIDPTTDSDFEADETVSLTLATGTGYTLGTTTPVIGTITNDDLPTVTLAVSPASVTEDSITNLVYTFTRSGSTASELIVNYTVGGTATLGTDYTGIADSPATKTVTFLANEATATVIVDPTADADYEVDETVSFTLASGTDYLIGTTIPVIGTIANDDLPSISLALTTATTTEDGPQNLFYVFSRTGDTTDPLTVNFTVGGGATFGSDYDQRGATSFTPTSGTVTFAAGSSTAILTLDPSSDAVSDGNETVALTLAEGTGYTVGTTTAVTGTILDNDVAPGTVTRAPVALSYPGRSRHEVPNTYAFAALKSDGSVVTWGDAAQGGDSSGVASQLTNGVTQIFSNQYAFAALKSDGSVVTWGDAAQGGNSSGVASQLTTGVTQVSSSFGAFAALKSNGSVVTWGDLSRGGDSSGVASQLTDGVTQIFSTNRAFAALKSNGSVITWGDPERGGDSSGVAGQLTDGVTQIFPNYRAFAALKNDGSVVAWGRADWGGDSSAVASQLSSGVTQIFSNGQAFAALKGDGSVVTWGDADRGGNSHIAIPGSPWSYVRVASQLSSGVTQIFSTDTAFAALKSDGSVVTWGLSVYGGDSNAVANQITSGVIQIFSNWGAFAALKSDGSVITWGDSAYGGNSGSVASELIDGVTQIFSTEYAFAALKTDGSVVTWGLSENGGDSSGVASQLSSGVIQIYSNGSAFAALKNDGSVITWGSPSFGGDSTAVASQLTSGVVSFADSFQDDFLVPLPTITLAVSPAMVIEDGSDNLVFTFSRTGNTASALTVNYTIAGSANASDYSGATPGTGKTISFAAGSSTVTLVIAPTADNTFEEDETVILTLASGTDYLIGTSAPVTGTIQNDDLPIVALMVSPVAILEDGSDNLTYTFFRTGDTSSTLTVNYTIAGSADASDYTGATPGTDKTLTFAAGSSTATLTIDPTADSDFEADETITLTLATGTGYLLGTTGAVTGTITNDDLPVITLAVSPASVTEDGTTNLVYTFTRTGDTTNPLTVNYTVGGTATLGTDYTGIDLSFATKTVTFLANAATATVTVDPTADTEFEADETVALTLAAGTGYTVGTTGAVTGTIINDDLPTITLAVSPATVTEDGTPNLVYTFTRTGDTTDPLTVNYTIAGSANATDYTGATPGSGKTITFAADSSTATLTLDPAADNTFEEDETVILTLTSGANYTIGTLDPVTGTIANDDLPIIALMVSPAAVLEDGSDNLTYTFFRTGDATNPLTVNYSIGGTADASDYSGATPGTGKTITFAAGSSTATLALDPTADTTIEATETIILRLRTGVGYTVGTTAGVTGRITNDDFPIVTLAVSPDNVSEDGSANLVYTFTRTGPTTNPLVVAYSVAGTASNSDYTGTTRGSRRLITFAAGSDTATLTIDPTADNAFEADETIALTLQARSGYTIGTTTAVIGTILNDDLPVITLAATDASAGETPNSGAFTLTRSGTTTNPLTVNLTLSGTAINGEDYITVPSTVTFASGASTARINITVVDDLEVEDPETIILNLADGTGYIIGSSVSNTVTIADNDWSGTSGNDTRTGNSARNALYGLAGNDNLNGGAGDDLLIGGLGKDRLTGGSGTDQFVFSTLADSLLAGFDVITDYTQGEQIDVPDTVTATTLAASSGNATRISTAAIQAVLTNTVFAANSARAFTITGRTGSFIALNDGIAGFNASTDSIIHLSNYTISTANPITLV